MKLLTNDKKKMISNDIWIISGGKYTDYDLSWVCEGPVTGAIKEYKISEISRYMLNPNQVQIEKKLIGCEIHYNQPASKKINDKVKRLLPEKMCGFLKDRSIPTESLLSNSKSNQIGLLDKNLEAHIEKVYAHLRPYDPVFKKLSILDKTKIYDILGTCEDFANCQSYLNLHGSIDDKIKYIVNNILKKVNVTIKKSYISEGLFEMRGFDFTSYNPQKKYSLLKLNENGETKYCVLNSSKRIEFWVEDPKLVYFMHLLEHSIKTNPKLADSFKQCASGDAKPLKIFFNKQIEINYSMTRLPEMYKNVFQSHEIGIDERDVVMNSLNHLQRIISFNYIPKTGNVEEKMVTNISVMHDVRALEPIKAYLPELYSEINKKAPISEAGKFYLLESIKGYHNE